MANASPERWWASARTWSRSANEETQGATLAGLHEKNVMAVIDEAGGVPSAVVAAGEGVLADAEAERARLIISGNPTHLSGPLWDAAKAPPGVWWRKHISGDPNDPNRAPRVSKAWAESMIAQYGRDSSYVRVRVFGNFPKQASDAIISLAWIEDAYGRHLDAEGEEITEGMKVLGVDVARFGDDQTVVCKRDGSICCGFDGWHGKDTVETANRVAMIAREFGAELIRVDDVGVGGGVTDQLLQNETLEVSIEGVNVGQSPTELGPDGKPIYADLRTQLAMMMRERWFQPGAICLDESVREDTTFEAEAVDIRYGFDRSGKVMKAESKDEYKKRHLGKSPDFWDAFVLAFSAEGGIMVL